MKENFLLITGGTGGHVIPAKNFANYLSNKNINCTIITDKRGYKYFDNYNGKIYIISSSNLNGNLIFKIFGIFQILLGLILNKVFGINSAVTNTRLVAIRVCIRSMPSSESIYSAITGSNKAAILIP